MENGKWIEYHSLTTVGDGSPIEFDIAGNGEAYVDLANTMLYVQVKITKQDGSVLDDDVHVGPVNLFLHSLFSQVNIFLNETHVTASTNTYPYRAMLETLLSYGDDAKKSQLTTTLYYEDKAGSMDAVTFDNADTRNAGLVQRRNFTARSWVVDMIGRIHADLFFQNRHLLNKANVNSNITFIGLWQPGGWISKIVN